jgi:hypothetical protein
MHGEEAFHRAILADKERGMSDPVIGARYGISFSTLEQIVTRAYGANISAPKRSRRIKRWEPSNFGEETTTVWSFKERGNWATHDGHYRGNWSPYIPRNVILKYSRPGDVVLDYFVGGGTTAVEAKLLGRRCIARDINPDAVAITLENLKFSPPPQLFGEGALPRHEPEVSVGDARDLSNIPSNSIDLICAHPPYAGIIKYSTNIAGDLSDLSAQDFLMEMRQVAQESLRVLKPGAKCAILIGDTRKSKYVVPIGFQTIRVFLNAGFILKELIIKRQHNCKTTGFWYARSIQYNFLLLAHEYLPVFEKPIASRVTEQRSLWEYCLPYRVATEQVHKVEEEDLETTSVWILPKDRLEAEVKRNLRRRLLRTNDKFVEIKFDDSDLANTDLGQSVSLLHVHWPDQEMTPHLLTNYRTTIRRITEQARKHLYPGASLVLEAKDLKSDEILWPTALLLYEDMANYRDFSLKEIVILAPDDLSIDNSSEHLETTHRCLLIYIRE